MTPFLLKMTAFGPYRAPQTLDFSLLKGSGLFLITGKTGAGKTTIFDAMSFALFGAPSGSFRRSDNLKSDFADLDEQCQVEFTFSVQGKVYTIFRSPKQKAAKKNGEEKELLPSALLRCEDTGQEISQLRQVDQEIQQILGLTREQFQKIVLLPQGEFRSFLDASSKEKQEIFREIFNTGLYDAFTQNLISRERTLRGEQKSLCDQLKGALDSTANTIGDDQLVQLSQAVPLPYTAVANRLHELLEELAPQRQKLSKQVNDLSKKKEQAALQLDQAGKINSKLDKLDSLRQDAKIQAEKTPEMDKIGAFLQRVSQVHLLSQYQSDGKKAANDLEKLNSQLTEATNQETDLTQRETEAKAALEAAQNAIKEKPAFEKSLEALTRIEEQYYRLNQALAEKRQLITSLQKKQEQAEKIALLRNRLEKQTAANQEAACVTILAEFQELQRKASQAADSYLTAKDAYFFAYNRFLDGQAGILASQLQENQPCPVCGSLNHPAKAPLPEKTPSQSEVDKLQVQMNAAQDASAKAHSLARQGWQKAAGLLEIHGENLPPYEELTGEVLAAVQESWRLRAEQSAAALRQAEKELAARLEARFCNDPKFADPENLERHTRRLAEELAGEQGKLQTTQDTIEAIRQEIPAAYPSQESAVQEKEHLRLQIQSLDDGLKKAEKNTSDLREKRAGLSQLLISLKEQIADAEARKTGAHQKFQALFAQHYSNPELYREDLALLLKEHRLREELETFRRKKAETDALLRSLEEETAGQARQPLEELEQKNQELETAKKEAQDALLAKTALEKHLTDLGKSWTEKREQLSTVEEALQTAKNLADTARGENPRALSFERYVMAGFFDEIVESANLRLQTMSSGRYSVSRKQEKERNGRSSGLDLQVLDVNTGKYRETNTLSGGESFLTSLALALAVAEIITRYSGGVEINTMLIDEGFGSLDADTLEVALDALQSLRTENRLIGIISHVEALAHHIPAKLVVTSTNKGSSAKILC